MLTTDAWLPRFHRLDALAYADHWLRQQHHGAEPPADALARWTDHLERLGIESVGGGLLAMRRVYLDGRRTLTEAAQTFADAERLPVAPFLPGLPAGARKLLALGLLAPAGD